MTISGIHAVEAALASPRLQPEEVLLREGGHGGHFQAIIDAARRRGSKVRKVARDRFEEEAGGPGHQGVALTVTGWPYLGEEELLSRVGGGGPAPFLLLLDHLQDVGNFGAVMRSAHLCGVDAVVIPRTRAAPVTTAAVRRSAGAAVYLEICRVANLVSLVERLKEAGVWVFGLDATATTSILEADLTVPLALILGGEHEGVSRLARERCDLLLGLPMGGRVGSFNAAVAAGIALFEVQRQRLATPSPSP